MSATLPKPMTIETFLEWEREQDFRYEFDGFDIVAMNGGTIEHARIGSNLDMAVRQRLRGSACESIRADLKVIVQGRVRYPDLIVTCSPVPRGSDIVPSPVVVFEIISKSTAKTDRILKNAEYAATETILHYVMIEQTVMAATVYSRVDGDWRGHLFKGEAVLEFPEIGLSLPLPPLYEDVELDEPG